MKKKCPCTTRRVIKPIIIAYNEHLEAEGDIDFSDMINKATELVRKGYTVHPYKWVIIDEYQDISVSRFNLVKAIIDQTNAKLLCVGDDWQSIYRFTGSDISLFTKFPNYFGKSEIMRIEKTYRNSQQLIDIAGDFIMKNSNQFKKASGLPSRMSSLWFSCAMSNMLPTSCGKP